MDLLAPSNSPEQTETAQTEVATAATVDLKDEKEDTPAEQTADAPMEDRKRDLEIEVQADASEAVPQSPVKKRRTSIGEIKEETKEETAEETAEETTESSSNESAIEEEQMMQKNLLEMASEDRMPEMTDEEAAELKRQLKLDERFAPLDEALANAQEDLNNLEAAREALKPLAKIDETDYKKCVNTVDELKKQRTTERNNDLEDKIAEAHTELLIAESKHLANSAQMHGFTSQIKKAMETIERLEKEREVLEQRTKEQFLREQGAGKILFQSNDPEEAI